MSASHSQELGYPHIQTCLPSTYTFVNRYNSIVQSDDGFLFIGARNGILCYNGSTWKHITIKGHGRLLNHENKIVVWCRTMIGSLEYSPSGEPELEKGSAWENGDIIRVRSQGSRLFILSTEGLFVRDAESLKKISENLKIKDIYNTGIGIISLSEKGEYYKLDGVQLEKTSPPVGIEYPSQPGESWDIEHISGSNFYYNAGKHHLVYTNPEGRMLDLVALSPILRSSGYNTAIELSNGYFAIGTDRDGVLYCSPEGVPLQSIGYKEGLFNNQVLQFLVDASGNLWALHEHAVSRIELQSAYSSFGPRNGLEGNITEILRFEDRLFAASSTGLYVLSGREQKPGKRFSSISFERITGIGEDVRCLEICPAGLATGSSNGLFLINSPGNSLQVTTILDEPVNKILYNNSNNLLLVGTDAGLKLMDVSTRTGIPNQNLPENSIDDIAISTTGKLWLSSRNGSLYRSDNVFRLSANLRFTEFGSGDLGVAPGSYIPLHRTSNNLYFSSPTGLYTYDEESGLFNPDATLNLPLTHGEYRIKSITNSRDQGFWITIEQRPENRSASLPYRTWHARPDEDGNFDIRPLTYRRLNSSNINCLFSENASASGSVRETVWFGTSKGIIRYDPGSDRKSIAAGQTHISGLQSAEASFTDQLDSELSLPYNVQSLRFEFLSTDFTCETEPMYQYRLEGHSEEWSDWSLNSFAEFGGLHKGQYQFQVRSQDIFGAVSNTSSCSFRIKPPPWSAWYSIVAYSIIILILIYYVNKWMTIRALRRQYHIEEVVQERTESLIQEKEKTESLLANILPKTTAEELKSTGKATSSKFKMCSVLFADIQGFTKIAEEMDADKLIDQLDRFYFHFDSVVEKYNIEKIKTIGDAYMAAGGIPIKNRTNPVEVVLAALEMQQYMKELKKSKSDIWDLRIGIHTGSVIAGVVGHKKYSYDIWGDTVNTASRMESSGEAGRVNVSATTYKLIKDFFQCEFRGKMPVKYKGDIAMFFVNGLNPVYSESDRITPNEKFFVQVQLLRLLDFEEFIIEKLEKELPEDLLFHNVKHTSHVYAQVELLGRGEKVSDEDLLLLRTAALLHDIGYIESDEDHEERSLGFAREILPLYRYQEDQIDRICDLISATKLPPEPKNLLEEIICDANLDHLGRVDFLIQSDKLFQEYRIRKKVKSKKDWNSFQVNFLKSHEFYTGIARKMREVPREQQIENIRLYS